MSYFGNSDECWHVRVNGPNTVMDLDLRNVSAIIYDRGKNDLTFCLIGGQSPVAGMVKEENAKMIYDNWKRAKR